MNSISSNRTEAVPVLRKPADTGWRYRAGVTARALAAIVGGYLAASLATRLLALVLPLSPVDRVVAATLSGLAIYPCAVMWCFAAASAARAWLGLGAACSAMALVLLALGTAGGGT